MIDIDELRGCVLRGMRHLDKVECHEDGVEVTFDDGCVGVIYEEDTGVESVVRVRYMRDDSTMEAWVYGQVGSEGERSESQRSECLVKVLKNLINTALVVGRR